jgi:lysylphosphatidylglycerol synthetase-like protein (DUF2156 family)
MSRFPDVLLRYFLNDFEKVPVAPVVSGITFVFTFHMRCISVIRFYILGFSQFVSWSHFCLTKLKRPLAHMFLPPCSFIIIIIIIISVIIIITIIMQTPRPDNAVWCDVSGSLGVSRNKQLLWQPQQQKQTDRQVTDSLWSLSVRLSYDVE